MSSVLSVARRGDHRFSKRPEAEITLVAGIGVEGDAHAGVTVRHRSRVAVDPTQPNLRQVHLIHHELLVELRSRGFVVSPGDLGENITTIGLELLGLPLRTRLFIGPEAVVEVTGLRNPCAQLDAFQPGLMKAVLGKDEGGRLVRKAGIMVIVVAGGTVRAGDSIRLELPEPPFLPLDRV